MGLQGAQSIVPVIECEDIQTDFKELVQSMERKERKKSLLKKKITDMKRKNSLAAIEENEEEIWGDIACLSRHACAYDMA